MRATAAGIGCLTGIAAWKRKRITALLANEHGPPYESDPARAVAMAKRNGGAVACWASRVPSSLPELAARGGVALWTIEDGFIRSSGLGAALVQPCSVVLESRVPHYDPSQPSDLETILQSTEFREAKLSRAQGLIELLRQTNVTKYNLAGAVPDYPEGRRIVLAIGQVEEDESMLRGAGGLTTPEFLVRVRQEEPDAFLVYRPHPDVVSGLRDGHMDGLADYVATDASMTALLARADSIHVMTSLAGFEALLRGKPVVTYGQPFYAGWGLTDDRAPIARRTRRLSLDQLVAGCLIDYPFYCHPLTGAACEVEELVKALAQQGDSRMPGLFRRIVGRIAGIIGRARG